MAETLNTWFTKFWDWLDGRGVIRRIILGITIWLTLRSFLWAAEFADSVIRTGMPGLEMAAVIASVAAVLAPVTALQTSVFKAYLESRGT